jgi:hypothetical protein
MTLMYYEMILERVNGLRVPQGNSLTISVLVNDYVYGIMTNIYIYI